MSSEYVFAGGSERRPMEVLPEGDYTYSVSDYDQLYQKPDGKWVLKLRLAIASQTIFDAVWSGETSSGEPRDGIGEFLLSCDRAPAIGQEPNWRALIGAKGKCHLKVEVAQVGALAGKERNVVAYYYRPKEIGPTTEPKAQEPKPAAGIGGEDEPDDIPFTCSRV